MTKKESEAVRRKQILDAALRCFARNGYHETRMDDVVQESGLTKGAIYFYFKGKRDLFIALIDRHLNEEKALWRKLLEEHELGPDLLVTGGLRHLKGHLEDNRIAPLMAESFAESYRDETIRTRIKELNDEWRGMVKEVFDQAARDEKIRELDSESLSSSILALIIGLVNQYWLSGGKLDYRRVWKEFSNALLEGIQKAGERP
jgi:AcrR family transcriptional regulator